MSIIFHTNIINQNKLKIVILENFYSYCSNSFISRDLRLRRLFYFFDEPFMNIYGGVRIVLYCIKKDKYE